MSWFSFFGHGKVMESRRWKRVGTLQYTYLSYGDCLEDKLLELFCAVLCMPAVYNDVRTHE